MSYKEVKCPLCDEGVIVNYQNADLIYRHFKIVEEDLVIYEQPYDTVHYDHNEFACDSCRTEFDHSKVVELLKQQGDD